MFANSPALAFPSPREVGRGCPSVCEGGRGACEAALSRLTPAAFATLSRKRERGKRACRPRGPSPTFHLFPLSMRSPSPRVLRTADHSRFWSDEKAEGTEH